MPKIKALGDEKVKKENNKISTGQKKTDFIVFVDKDGTLDLEDEQLNNIFMLITVMGGMIIPITGRTVGDIKEKFIDRNILLPQIIVGDNGANIYSTLANKFIMKKTLENKKVNKTIKFFIKNGGDPNLIRYTDGRIIYASNEENIKKYYEENNTVKLLDNIEKATLKSKEITKVTLAGSKKEMENISKYVETLGFWTDMDKTKFPKKEEDNYRLDIAQKNISKGNAVKEIVNRIKPQYGYMCVGNGWNDLSMFKQAIDDGMKVAIMGNADPELIKEVKEYRKNKNKGRIIIVPIDKNRANKLIYKEAKAFQTYIRTNQFRAKKKLPNVPRVKIKHPNNHSKTKNKHNSKRNYEKGER